MDYVGSMNNSLTYAVAVEKLMGLELNERVQAIRVITSELQRIASHLLAIGTYGLDIGAFTPFLHCFREREKVLDLFEWLCGARLLYNYNWIILPRDKPKMPTLEGVWPTANWHEREAYDLFGIEFVGHSDMRRIFLPEDWAGHPLRKDWEWPDEWHGIPVKPDEKFSERAQKGENIGVGPFD